MPEEVLVNSNPKLPLTEAYSLDVNGKLPTSPRLN